MGSLCSKTLLDEIIIDLFTAYIESDQLDDADDLIYKLIKNKNSYSKNERKKIYMMVDTLHKARTNKTSTVSCDIGLIEPTQ